MIEFLKKQENTQTSPREKLNKLLTKAEDISNPKVKEKVLAKLNNLINEEQIEQAAINIQRGIYEKNEEPFNETMVTDTTKEELKNIQLKAVFEDGMPGYIRDIKNVIDNPTQSEFAQYYPNFSPEELKELYQFFVDNLK